ncbi:MAG: LacI family DNA-binding transcriptional regulator [Culicoidibacterales bacterium]
MASIHDVAKLAGVSVSSVSKAFNEYSDISEKTKQKILLAAKELNYAPNMIAKSLSQKKTKTIAFLFSNFEDANSQDNVAFRLMQGAFAQIAKEEYELVVFTTTQAQQQSRSYYQFCRERNVAGVIIHGIRTTDRYLQEIINSDIPCVIIDTNVVGKKVSSLGIDNVKAAKTLIDSLITKGHKEIGLIGGHHLAVVTQERELGYQQALKAAKLPIRPETMMIANFSEKEAYQLAERYLKVNPQVTAVFCMSDLMAIGFIQRCHELGVKIPEQLSVVGFDDIDLARYVTPKLTTIHQDFHLFGSEACKMLIELIETTKKGRHKFLTYKLVDRESVNVVQS